jgi:hypothetical protein
MRRIKFSLIFFLCTNFSVHALDDNRKGFCLGVDIGAGLQMSFPRTYPDSSTYAGKPGADLEALTDFKVGFSTTGRTAFFLSSRNQWNQRDKAHMSINSILLEIDHFNRLTAPSFFVSYGAGWGWLLFPDQTSEDQQFWANGFSAFAGYGYEFMRHYSAKIECLFNSLLHSGTVPETGEFSPGIISTRQVPYHRWYDVATLRLTVGYLFY